MHLKLAILSFKTGMRSKVSTRAEASYGEEVSVVLEVKRVPPILKDTREKGKGKGDLLAADVVRVPSQDAVNGLYHFQILVGVHVMERCSIKQNFKTLNEDG